MDVGNLFAEYGIGVLTAVGVLFAILTFLNSRKGQREQRRRWEIKDIEEELAHEGDLANRKSELENRLSLSGYLSRIDGLNRQLDEFFGPIWSTDSLSRCLQFSLLYPISFFVVAWVLGGSGIFADLDILPARENILDRLTLAALTFVLSYACVFFILKSDEIEASIYRSLERRIRIKAFKNKNELKPWITRLLEWVSSAGSIALLVSALTAGAFVVGFGAVAVAVGAVAIGVNAAGGAISASAVAVATGAVAVVGGAVGIGFGSSFSVTATFVFFFAGLPIVNAALDFLSLAGTRFLLAHAARLKERKHAGVMLMAHVFGDLLLAFMFLIFLSALLPNTIEAMNVVMRWLEIQPIDLREYIALARDDPFGGGVMVWGMLLTTLMPTLLHFSVGIAGWFSSRSRTDEIKKLLLDNPEPLSPRIRKTAARLLVERERWWIGALLSSLFILASVLGVLFLMAHLGFSLETIALWSVSWRG